MHCWAMGYGNIRESPPSRRRRARFSGGGGRARAWPRCRARAPAAAAAATAAAPLHPSSPHDVSHGEQPPLA